MKSFMLKSEERKAALSEPLIPHFERVYMRKHKLAQVRLTVCEAAGFLGSHTLTHILTHH